MKTKIFPGLCQAFRLRLCAASMAVIAATTSMGAAAEIKIDCAANETGPQLSLRYVEGTLSITEAAGTTDVGASIQLDPSGIFTINGAGPMDAAMPGMAALDECIVTKLKQQDATAADNDALVYVANLCRLKLQPTATMQKVQAIFTATSIDPKKAMLFVQRQYLSPSAVTGKPMQLDEWPTRNCDVLTGP